MIIKLIHRIQREPHAGGRERIAGDIWRASKLPWLPLGRQRGVKACSRGWDEWLVVKRTGGG